MGRKKILMIDDDKDLLTTIKFSLEQGGAYEVVAFPDARDIVGRVKEFRPDIILMDILMPAVGGLDACKKLNKDPVGKNTPIIILSGLDEAKDKLRAYKLGVVDYVAKPFSKEDLIARIEQALEFK